MAWDWLYFGLGALGALAPEAIRLFRLATDKGTYTFTWFYVVISLVFAAIGGVIAVILPAPNPIGAVYAGAAWPALIAAGAKTVGGGGGVVKAMPAHGDGMNLVEPAPPAPQPASIGSFFRAL